MGEPTEKPARRRVNVISAMMSLVTVAAIVGAAWLRYGPTTALDRNPATVVTLGEEALPLRLLDLKTGEPLVLVGLSNRVVWVIFWSAEPPSGRECLSELEPVWKKLKVNRRFALVTAAVDGEDPREPEAWSRPPASTCPSIWPARRPGGDSTPRARILRCTS